MENKLVVTDANALDEKIPRNLILMYDKTPHILKAGLEWKARQIYPNGYSLELEPITMDWEKGIFVFKAKFIAGAISYVNFGEARRENCNTMMQKQMFHLAATRAECRVLRMATACGYASYEEVDTQGEGRTIPTSPDDDKPITEAQIEAIRAMHKTDDVIEMPKTQGEAKILIAELTGKK